MDSGIAFEGVSERHFVVVIIERCPSCRGGLQNLGENGLLNMLAMVNPRLNTMEYLNGYSADVGKQRH